MNPYDLVVVGAGASGLAAAIFAAEAAAELDHPLVIAVVDGAPKPGAKILVSGGGRCNVTHVKVTPDDYNGGPAPSIRSVLRAFDEKRAVAWFASLGVPLRAEPDGKYFPESNSARSVLDALLGRLDDLGVALLPGRRVVGIHREVGETAAAAAAGFRLEIADGTAPLHARALIVATGGMAMPKSGSDGAALDMLRALGHGIVPTTPALVPLVLRPGPAPGGRFAEFAGVTLPMRIGLYAPGGKALHETTNSLLFTHFGLSGPAALDFSRHWLRARLDDPAAPVRVALGVPSLPTPAAADRWLLDQGKRVPRKSIVHTLMQLLPERLARAYAESAEAALAPTAAELRAGAAPLFQSDYAASLGALGISQIPRAARRLLAEWLTRLPVEVVGDRGYAFAEATAGGVDLREVAPATMESRRCPGLYVCGEALDVDGRIGGFNFHWAWATGSLAGRAAARSRTESKTPNANPADRSATGAAP